VNNLVKGYVAGAMLGEAARPSSQSHAYLDSVGAKLREDRLEYSLKTQRDITGMWQGTTHALRAKLNARVEAEQELLAQLAEANAELAQISGIPDLEFDLPLATPEGLEALATEKFKELFVDEKIIKLTFNDGRLPKESKDALAEAVAEGRPVNWTK
jgi:hypothetical protein